MSTRSLSVLLLLSVAAGCGVAPSGGESAGGLFVIPQRCPDGSQFISTSYEVTSSSYDPWGHVAGDVVSYEWGTSSVGKMYLVFGYDPVAKAVVWYMTDATIADVDRFESYPQSTRYCGGLCPIPGGGCTNNPNAGTGKNQPDPHLLPGVCVPSTIAGDAAAANVWGPQGGDRDYCGDYGPGGCIPQSCSALRLGCGSHVNNCGQVIWCGACPNPPPNTKCDCGGTYPRCKLCI